MGIYLIVAEKSVKHWNFWNPECTITEFDFSPCKERAITKRDLVASKHIPINSAVFRCLSRAAYMALSYRLIGNRN